jgi:hypothetical protein
MSHIDRDLGDILTYGGGVGCFVLVISFIAYIAFLAAAARVLARIEPENRRMEIGQVWLNLIPLFNLLWMVVTVERIGESIRNEFLSRGRYKKSESYGKTTGLAWLVLTGVGVPFAAAGTPCVLVFWFLAFIYWVVYWAQLSGYARRLNSENPSYAPPVDEGW